MYPLVYALALVVVVVVVVVVELPFPLAAPLLRLSARDRAISVKLVCSLLRRFDHDHDHDHERVHVHVHVHEVATNGSGVKLTPP